MRRLIKAPAVIASPATRLSAKPRAFGGGRSNLTLLLILLSIAVTAPISAEEIKLATIVPDQTVLRAKKGTVGDGYSTSTSPTYVADVSIPANGLLVEGNVGIGTTSPATKLEVNGIMRLAPTSPSSGTAGMIYYGTDNIMRYHNGTTWVPIGGGSGGAFGNWQNWNFSGSMDFTITAATDGIIVAHAYTCTDLRGYTKLFPLIPIEVVAASVGVSEVRSITFPVRKNDPWRVTSANTDPFSITSVWWLPMGN